MKIAPVVGYHHQCIFTVGLRRQEVPVGKMGAQLFLVVIKTIYNLFSGVLLEHKNYTSFRSMLYSGSISREPVKKFFIGLAIKRLIFSPMPSTSANMPLFL